jgi:hypothetical protein
MELTKTNKKQIKKAVKPAKRSKSVGTKVAVKKNIVLGNKAFPVGQSKSFLQKTKNKNQVTVNKQQILRSLQEEGVLKREELFTKGHAICKEITKFDAGRAVRHFVRNGKTKDEKIARSLLSGNNFEQTKKLLGLKRINPSKYKVLLEDK